MIHIRHILNITHSAFSYCYNLEEVSIPFSLEVIEDDVFLSCENMKKLDLSQCHIRRIGNKSFKDCKKIYKILFPESVESIEFSAFENCVELEKVTLSSRIVSIGNHCFKCC